MSQLENVKKRIHADCMNECEFSENRDNCYRKCVNSTPYDGFGIAMMNFRGTGNPTCSPNFFNDDPNDWNYYFNLDTNTKYGDKF